MTEHGNAEGHHEGDHGDDHGGVALFMRVFIALCILTAISFGVANWPAVMKNPTVGWTLMMAVSCVKAMLVITFFMHLKWEANWKYVLTIPASIMSMFLLIMLVPDIGWRTRHYTQHRWLHSATAQENPADAKQTDHGDH